MEKGLVSSITPVYNTERFIEETVMSILRQTYKKMEIILVDDCSIDGSSEIIERLAKTYPNVRYERLKKNEGAAAARNHGLRVANGQYVAFCDSDDLWKPEKIEKELSWAKEKDADFVFTAIEIIDEKGQIIKNKRAVCEYVDYDFLLQNTMIATSSVLLDMSRIGKFQMPNIRSFQDYATWLMLLRNGRKAYGLDEALVQYRKRKGSLSYTKYKSPSKVWNVQTKFEHIKKTDAFINCVLFCINGIKKHYF